MLSKIIFGLSPIFIFFEAGSMGGSEQQVTRVLFCGQQFSASYDYTKEYLSNYPHIQVN